MSNSASGNSLRVLAAARGIRLGTALVPHLLDQACPYAEIAATEFGSVTAENAMKWDHLAPTRSVRTWDGADRVMAFAQAHGQQVRGHTLLWHNQNPGWLSNGDISAAGLRAALRDHIGAVVGRYAGRIGDWDVVNEPFERQGEFRRSLWYEALGPGYIAEALSCARSADPAAKLYINDYGIEGFCAKSDALYVLVRDLKRRDVPLDGIGFQCHLRLGRMPPRMQENLQRFADLDVDIAITELDIAMDMPPTDGALLQQGEQFGTVVRACLGVERTRSITVWGFTDAASWIPGRNPDRGAATLYDENYRPKPAYYAFAEALVAMVIEKSSI